MRIVLVRKADAVGLGGMAVALIAIFVVPACYCGIKQIKWQLGLSDPTSPPIGMLSESSVM